MTSKNQQQSSDVKQPIFSFGVIADGQYADVPDGRSFIGVPRYYRHSFQVLQRAVSHWNSLKKLKFIINFGDTVDGSCPKHMSLTAIHKVLKEFNNFLGPVYHMIGNHCLYNLPHSDLISLFEIPSLNNKAYYEFSPSPECRIVILDGYDVSALGRPHDDPRASAAIKILEERNSNANKNSPAGLAALEKRFLMFNGAVGKDQLEWLDNVLKECTERK